MISEPSPEMTEGSLRISPAPAAPKRNCLPCSEVIEMLSSPSSRNRTLKGCLRILHEIEFRERYIRTMDARESALANLKWQLDLLRADEKRLQFLVSCQSTTVGTRTRAVTQLPYVRERLQALARELSRMEKHGA